MGVFVLSAADFINHIISIAMIGLIILFVLGLILTLIPIWAVLFVKRRITLNWLRTASDQLRVAKSRVSATIVSDTFKDLELGWMPENSRRILSDLQNTAFSLHRQSEQLHRKIQGQQAPFFSLVKPLYRSYRIKRDVQQFSKQVEFYLHNLAKYENHEKQVRQHRRRIKAKFEQTSEMIQRVAEENGLSLETLKRMLKKTEVSMRQAERLETVDSLQSRAAWDEISRDLDALQTKMENLQKNFAVYEGLRSRFHNRKKHWMRQLEPAGSASDRNSVSDLFQRSEHILQRIEDSLQLGEDVDVRAAAAEIEHILDAVLEKIE